MIGDRQRHDRDASPGAADRADATIGGGVVDELALAEPDREASSRKEPVRAERWALVELRWVGWAGAALFATLQLFAVLLAALNGLPFGSNPGDLNAFLANALGLPWSVAANLWPFLVAALLGYRLLVPTFAGRPAWLVGSLAVGLPVLVGSSLVYAAGFADWWNVATGIVWALAIPLPREDPRGSAWFGELGRGLIAGAAFAALAYPVGGLVFAIVWTAWLLYRRRRLEAAAAGIAASILPALLAVSEMPARSLSANGALTALEVAVCMSLGVLGLVWWQLSQPVEGA